MSYIPRSSSQSLGIPGAIPKLVKKKHTFRVFGLIATIAIVGASLSVVSTYVYKAYALSQLSQAREALKNADAMTPKNTTNINALFAFDKKLDMASVILDNHLSPSTLFSILEEMTKKEVRLLAFTYTYDPGFQAILKLTGTTNEFTTVASQHMEFMEGSLFSEYVLEDITTVVSPETQEEENAPAVTFSLTGALHTDVFSYKTAIRPKVEGALPVIDDVTADDVPQAEAPAVTAGEDSE